MYQVSKNPIHFSRIESYPFIEPLKLPVPTSVDFNSHADNRELLESYLVLGICVSQVPNNEKIRVISLYAGSSLKQQCPENNSSLIVLLLYGCASIFFKWLCCAFCTYTALYYTLQVSFKGICILIFGHMVCSFANNWNTWSCSKVIWGEASLWSLYFQGLWIGGGGSFWFYLFTVV